MAKKVHEFILSCTFCILTKVFINYIIKVVKVKCFTKKEMFL